MKNVFIETKISDFLVDKITQLFSNTIYNRKIIDLSAWNLNFINSLINYKIPKENIIVYNIPSPFYDDNLIINNYFKEHISYSNNNFILGKTPFSNGGILAIDILNKALNEAPFVALMLPMSFKKYDKQKQIIPNAQLLWEIDLPKSKQNNVDCVFQLWSNGKVKSFLENKRILCPV
ncbi:hypothetical protein [Mycoplasma sp. 3686d]|uniref:hypothetical protein n=1 Tax=Mycoplasma sp. 3686d TaxID=2967300 RepID=UPI00211CBC4E|nr:hypothetical protein [Mycoplasma sp. 3686d]UUM24565.1 hypothetical protein NPA12_02585 [Mycoplasma sp. 3686d]